jgi:hypothetical protein
MQRTQVDVTTRLLGPSYAGNMRQWLETYEQFLAIYTDPNLRRSARLSKFNDLFRAMFIDRHPAYPLYRHWYNLVEQSPEFPAPPTSEPTPRITEPEEDEEEPQAAIEPRPFVRVESSAPSDEASEDEFVEERAPRHISPAAILIAIGGLIQLAIAAIFISRGGLGGLGGTPAAATSTVASVASSNTSQAVAVVTDEAPTDTPTIPVPTLAPATDVPTTIPVVLNTVPPRGSETAIPSRTPSDTPTSTDTSTPTATATFTASNTPPPTMTPSATLPPSGLHGQQDLLHLISALQSPDWSSEQFSPGEDGDYWRLGTGESIPGGTVINITIPQQVLETIYGNFAADRIQSVEADLELATFNPPLLIDNQVYFGLMLEPVNDPNNPVGAQIQVAEPGVFNIGQRVGSTVTITMQRSQSDQTARIRLERDLNGNALAVYVNNQQVGPPLDFAGTNNPVIPVLYVRAGGVVVHVTRWQITLR